MLATNCEAVNAIVSQFGITTGKAKAALPTRAASFWVVEEKFGPTREEWEAAMWCEAEELRRDDEWLMHEQSVIGDCYGVDPDEDPDFWAECQAAGWD